jgi:hypothetical protein
MHTLVVHPNESPVALTCGTYCLDGPACHTHKGRPRENSVFFFLPNQRVEAEGEMADGDGGGLPVTEKGGMNFGGSMRLRGTTRLRAR